jgi:hypothetical protein
MNRAKLEGKQMAAGGGVVPYKETTKLYVWLQQLIACVASSMLICSKPDYQGVLKGIEYVPIVSGPERAKYEAIGQAAWGQFMFTNVVPNSTGVTLPRCPALEYYPILYLWPVNGNTAAIGARAIYQSVGSWHGTHALFLPGIARRSFWSVFAAYTRMQMFRQRQFGYLSRQAVAFAHLLTLAAYSCGHMKPFLFPRPHRSRRGRI